MIERLITEYDLWNYDYDINRKITLVAGDSGTGKTKFFDLCNTVLTHEYDLECVDCRDEKVYRQFLEDIKVTENRLYIVDRLDANPSSIYDREIILRSSNQFVIIGRDPQGLLLLPDNIKNIVYDTNNQKSYFINMLDNLYKGL